MLIPSRDGSLYSFDVVSFDFLIPFNLVTNESCMLKSLVHVVNLYFFFKKKHTCLSQLSGAFGVFRITGRVKAIFRVSVT